MTNVIKFIDAQLMRYYRSRRNIVGATALEYGLIAVGVSIAIITVVGTLAQKVH